MPEAQVGQANASGDFTAKTQQSSMKPMLVLGMGRASMLVVIKIELAWLRAWGLHGKFIQRTVGCQRLPGAC